MALINWQPDFSVNVAEIDEQHQLLVNMINDLYDAMRARKEKEVLGKLLSRLSVYAAMHFAKEEHYFDLFDYPEAEAHKNEHFEIEQKIMQLESDFNNGAENISMEIMKFLSNWLIGHIKASDRKYGPFLNERGLR